ncbi:MAG: DUF1015 family protein [Actinomycetales bacterium]
MPAFEPFTGYRYHPGAVLEDVLAPPYDVLSDADVLELTARSAENIVHVDVPEGAADRYRLAADRLRQWIADEVLVPDHAPTLTLYRMDFTDQAGRSRQTVGVIGALEVVDQGAGGVLPHERTTAKASTDRLDLTRATRANLSPVWGLSLATGLSQLLADPGDPLGSIEVDGVLHGFERVADPDRLAAICAAVSGDDVLIADGHHRYGVARAYRDEVRASTGSDRTPAERTMAYVAELAPDQLSIEAIHRVYTDVDPAALESALADRFEIAPAIEPGPELLREMSQTGRLALLTGDGTRWLSPRPGAFDGVRALDGAWLEAALERVPHTVSYSHDVTGIEAQVRAGQVVAAVLIRPTSMAEIERTAREGLLMPPKSTFFTPKLRTGVVLRSLA